MEVVGPRAWQHSFDWKGAFAISDKGVSKAITSHPPLHSCRSNYEGCEAGRVMVLRFCYPIDASADAKAKLTI